MSTRTMLLKLKVALGAKSQRDLGQRLGLAEGTVSKMMGAGPDTDMGLQLLRRMAERAGLPITQLVEWWDAGDPVDEAPPSGYHRASMRQPLAIDKLWHQRRGQP